MIKQKNADETHLRGRNLRDFFANQNDFMFFVFFILSHFFKILYSKVSTLTLTRTCDRQTQMISNANIEGSVIKKDDTFMILSENFL